MLTYEISPIATMTKEELAQALTETRGELYNLDAQIAAWKREAERWSQIYTANQQAQEVLISALNVVTAAQDKPTETLMPYLLATVEFLIRDANGILFNAEPFDSEGGTVYRHDGDDEIVTDYSPAGQVTAVRVNGALEVF